VDKLVKGILAILDGFTNSVFNQFCLACQVFRRTLELSSAGPWNTPAQKAGIEPGQPPVLPVGKKHLTTTRLPTCSFRQLPRLPLITARSVGTEGSSRISTDKKSQGRRRSVRFAFFYKHLVFPLSL
jgi:hypothetical protein